jgi:hypothetical protein
MLEYCRGSGKFLDAPNPRGRVLNPRRQVLASFFAFFAVNYPIPNLSFGCGCAAPCRLADDFSIQGGWRDEAIDR